MVIDFPKNKLVYGPAQVEARISNDPVISSQLTLWNQAGSEVIRGNLLVVPIKQSIMYFEPVYLQAEQSPIPELTRVIVAYGDDVVMEPTLSDALIKIFGEPIGDGTTTTAGATTTTRPPSTTTTTRRRATTTTTTGGTPTTLPADAAALIALAEPALPGRDRGPEARRLGEYGRQIEALGRGAGAL